MSFILSDRIKETTITQGTGTITLAGALGGFVPFSSIGEGNSTYYVIENGTIWEIGIGTYSSGTLSRDTVLSSSSGGSKISLSGVSYVFVALPASKSVTIGPDGNFNIDGDITTDNIVIEKYGIFNNVVSTGTILSSGNIVSEGDISSKGLLTLTRDSAGNFFHAYVDDSNDRTIALYSDATSAPEWKLGLKSSPSSETSGPTYAYVYGEDGSIGLYANSLNYLSLNHGGGFNLVNKGDTIFSTASATGTTIEGQAAAFPTLILRAAPAQSDNIQEWQNSSQTVLTKITNDGTLYVKSLDVLGEISANTARGVAISGWAKYYVDIQDHSSASVSGYFQTVVNGIADATSVSGALQPQITQNTIDIVAVSGLIGGGGASDPSGEYYLQEIRSNSASGISISGALQPQISQNVSDIAAVSGWAQSYVDSQDHSAAAVSGWARDYVDSQDHSAAAVSGWADSTISAGDIAVSGWAEATFLTVDDDSYISGVAVYASGHNLQSITDNGATTNNAITINSNLTAENLFGDLYGPIVFECKNDTGSQIDAGTPVYISGYYSNNGKSLIAPAIGNDATKMPAVGILSSNLTDGSEGHVHVFGEVPRIDTSSFNVGDTVYVDPTGGLTNTRPTGVEELVQNIGRVLRSDASQGKVLLLGPGRTNDVPNSGAFSELSVGGSDIISQITAVSGWAESYVDSQDHSALAVSGWARDYVDSQDHSALSVSGALQPQITQNALDIVTVSGLSSEAYDDTAISGYFESRADANETQIASVSGWAESYVDSQDHSAVAVSGWAEHYVDSQDHSAVAVSGWADATFSTTSVSGITFEVSGVSNEYRVGTTFIDPDGTEQVVRSTSISNGYLRLEVANFSPSVSAAGQSRYWDQPVSQWTVSIDNPTDFTSNYISGVAPALSSIVGSVTSGVSLYTTTGPSTTPAGGVDWTQTFTVDGDSPIYSSTSDLSGGSASATVSFLDKYGDTSSETATISFSWQSASSSISFNSLTGNNFLESYSSVGYNLTITGLSNSSNASTTITTGQGTLSNSSDDGTMTFTTAIHKDNNSGRTITATTDFTRPATVTGTEYTTQRVVSDSSISASFTYPSFYIFTSSTSNPPSRADIIDTNDFDATVVTELGNQSKTVAQTITNSESIPQCWWFAVRSSASQPTSFETGSGPSLLVTVTPTVTTVDLEPDSAPAGYSAEEYKLYGITLNAGDTYVKIS